MKKLRIHSVSDSTKYFECHVEEAVVPILSDSEKIKGLASYLFTNFNPGNIGPVHVSLDASNNFIVDVKPAPAAAATLSPPTVDAATMPPPTVDACPQSLTEDTRPPAHKKIPCNHAPSQSYSSSSTKFRPKPSVIIQPFLKDVNMNDLATFLNDAAVLYCIVGEGTTVVKHISPSLVQPGGFDVEFMNEHVASQMAYIENLTFEDELVILTQERERINSNEFKSEVVKVSNLPWDFKEFANPATASEMSRIHPFQYGKNVLKVEMMTANNAAATPPAATTDLTEAPGSEFNSPKITVDLDVIRKAAQLPGQVAQGKLGGTWDQAKGELFLKVAVAYKDINGSLPYDKIRAHLWVHFNLDFSEEQLREKLRSTRNYFVHTVMRSESGLDGTSKYPHYDSMLELFPSFKSDKIVLKRKELETELKDTWDSNAVNLLLAEYKSNQSLFNSVKGTHRTIDVFKLVSMAMNNAGRSFSPEECKKRMESLNATFFTLQDLSGNQTGSGSSAMDPEHYSALQAIHDGSVAMEPPLTFSVGSTSNLKRGNYASVKVLGGSRPVKLRRSWDWQTDSPLTANQRRVQLENQRAEAALQVQRETLNVLASLAKRRSV